MVTRFCLFDLFYTVIHPCDFRGAADGLLPVIHIKQDDFLVPVTIYISPASSGRRTNTRSSALPCCFFISGDTPPHAPFVPKNTFSNSARPAIGKPKSSAVISWPLSMASSTAATKIRAFHLERNLVRRTGMGYIQTGAQIRENMAAVSKMPESFSLL